MRRRLWFFILLLGLPPGVLGAESPTSRDLLDAARRGGLARDPVWLKLLGYERGGQRSEIITDDFFLSPRGRYEPASELSATIEAYLAPWGRDADRHPRCRFPGRYFWLSQHLPLPGYRTREPRCARLEKWALPDRVRSISMLLVSGYYGNPASTFGHALLKLNTDSADDPAGLFDLTLNYGALVPENELTLFYVARGLFGGYRAGFSDKYFYTQDLVYLHTEFRDIWNYELMLSDYERTLLILHIWEVIGKKFRYYFLDKNCVYRLAELLELATGERLLDKARVWYVPVELFHRLNRIDARRRASGGAGLIRKVRFIPSSRRTLYHRFAALKPPEAEAANAIIREGVSGASEKVKAFTEERQGEILDAVLAYHQYRIVAEQPSPGPERRREKDRVLLARLRLPPGPASLVEVPSLPSPAERPPPMAVGLGAARTRNGESYLRLLWSPFTQELTGESSLDGGELVVLDVAVGLGEGPEVFVDGLDLVRIRKLNSAPVEVAGESRWSWELRIGAARVERDGKGRHDGILSLGAGRAWRGDGAFGLYLMADLAAHTLSPFLRVRPHLGLTGSAGPVHLQWLLGAESTGYDAKFRGVWGGAAQLQLSARDAVRLEVSGERAARAAIALIRYW